MKVKELIIQLLNEDLDGDVYIVAEGNLVNVDGILNKSKDR